MYIFVILINIFFIYDVFAQDITQSVAAYKQGKAEILTLEENIKQYKSQLSQIDENIRGLLANKQSIQKELANLNNVINWAFIILLLGSACNLILIILSLPFNSVSIS